MCSSDLASVPFYPEVPGIAGNPRVLHSGDFLNCMAYDRRRVLVIGGANSAAELCIELAGTAHTTMCTRGPLRYFSETGELDHIRGSSESVLKELFRFGILSLREADPVVSLSDGTADLLRELTPEAAAFLTRAAERLSLSGRAIGKACRVARTIADLAAEGRVALPHAAEALQYRLSGFG